MPREESFPIPLKYFDVTRSTHTDLDVAQEERFDVHLNVEENRSLSDSWTGFTRCTITHETRPKGNMWSGERMTKIQTTSRPDHIWTDALTRIGKSRSKKRETRIGNRETKTRICQNFEENLFYCQWSLLSQCTVVWFSQHRTPLVPCMSDIHVDTTSSQVFHQSFVHTPAYTCSVTFSRMSTIHITAVLLW